jgi:hypothetical protein
MKTQKEAEMKDSIIRDERTRLHNEAMRSHGVNMFFKDLKILPFFNGFASILKSPIKIQKTP